MKKHGKKKFEDTLWYKWAHHSDHILRKGRGGDDYTILKGVVDTKETWRRVYDATIGERIKR